ncbi:5'/3'-nucleotidase SurE [Luedemannella flava]
MTRVLVTNDDGIAAPGLRWLARAAADRGLDVTVAAPRHESSGTSAALTAVTVNGRVAFDRTDLDGVPAYAVAASPSYITLLAGLGAFGPVPDVVLSGVNKGANAGHGILHSGTVGAALTAAMNGLRGMAVSLDVISPVVARGAGSGGAVIAALDLVDDETRHWGTAADVAVRLLPWLHTAGRAPCSTSTCPTWRPTSSPASARRRSPRSVRCRWRSPSPATTTCGCPWRSRAPGSSRAAISPCSPTGTRRSRRSGCSARRTA